MVTQMLGHGASVRRDQNISLSLQEIQYVRVFGAQCRRALFAHHLDVDVGLTTRQTAADNMGRVLVNQVCDDSP